MIRELMLILGYRASLCTWPFICTYAPINTKHVKPLFPIRDFSILNSIIPKYF